ncbi:MAG: YoaK family protein [Candidatus Nanopelagicales bacterium]
MRSRTITPGVYLLTAVCGLIDAASFLALGGVFAEIMTGNIMFLAFQIGQGGGWEVVPRFLVPLAAFSTGAVGCGFLLMNPRFGERRRHAFVVVAVLVAIATLLALVWMPAPEGSEAMIIVAILAFAMGMQNAAVLYHAVPDVATNVMTLTLVRLLSNWSVVGGNNQRWQFRITSLSVFFVAALIGAALVRISAGAALVVALAVYLVALPFLILGRSPADRATT